MYPFLLESETLRNARDLFIRAVEKISELNATLVWNNTTALTEMLLDSEKTYLTNDAKKHLNNISGMSQVTQREDQTRG